VFYGFTPEAFKSGGQVNYDILNRPLIANYGAYYRIPFGSEESVQQRINDSTRFGYDEATHQFLLPPPGSRPDLTFSASGSSSDNGRDLFPVHRRCPNAPARHHLAGFRPGNHVQSGGGGGLNVPFALSDTRRFNLSAGVDWKHDERDSYNTNGFLITTVFTNAQGSETIESRVASPQPVRYEELTYVPLNLGFDFSESDAHGSLSAHLGLSGISPATGPTSFRSPIHPKRRRSSAKRHSL